MHLFWIVPFSVRFIVVNSQVLLPPQIENSQIKSDFAINKLTTPHGTFMVLGASGTIGRWLTSTLLQLPPQRTLPNRVIACGRDPMKLSALFGHLAVDGKFFARSIGRIEEAIQEFRPDYIWHLAANTGLPVADPDTAHFLADSMITSRVLNCVTDSDYRPVIFYTSSGAVYGRNRIEDIAPIEIDAFNLPVLAEMGPYERAKIASEEMLLKAFHDDLIDLRIARLYAFVGPLIPTDQHFAIGNFLRDAELGNPIRMKSAGIDYRSWMNFRDLIRSLLLFASHPSARTLNIGSPEVMQIREAAELVAQIANTRVVMESNGSRDAVPHYYFPNLDKFNSLIELPHQATLKESIIETIAWLQATRKDQNP